MIGNICSAISLAVLLTGTAACDEEKPTDHYILKEVIDVQGTCSEDHVGQIDSYAGQIVRWQTVRTGTILTYGFVTKKGDATDMKIKPPDSGIGASNPSR
jgi:hypothetical protein